jgi:hypothetical protein
MTETEEVRDPNELVQRRRLEQILYLREEIREIATELEAGSGNPRKKKKALAVSIRSYVRDIEELRQHYPKHEPRWTEEEIGTIDTRRNISQNLLRSYSSVEGREIGPGYFKGSEMEIQDISPQKFTVFGLNDFLKVSPELTVEVKWRSKPDVYTQEFEFERYISIQLPHHILDKTYRTANLYLSDIGLTATADMGTGDGLEV